MISKLSSLSLFFPCFNDSKTIAGLVEQAYAMAPEYAWNFEVIVVDDGSTDESLGILNGLKARYPGFRVISHERNKGYGGALASGFKAVSHDFVFYTDGDAQYSLEDLPAFVNLALGGAVWVNGYKIKRHDSWLRGFLGAVYNQTVKFFMGIKLRDMDCDFRLFQTKLVREIKLTFQSGAVCAQMVSQLEKQGAKAAELPVKHYARPYGSSQFFNFKSLAETLRDILKLILRPVYVR